MKTFNMMVVLIAVFLFSAMRVEALWRTERISANAGDSRSPAVALNGSNIYVVWFDDTTGNFEIYFKRSTDGGATWQSANRLTNNAADSEYPDIAVSGANIYVVWHDGDYGSRDIYFRKSADSGVTWKASQRLTNNAGMSWVPAIAVSGTNVVVAWSDGTPGNNEIYIKKSADGGATWQASKKITNNTGGSCYPDIAVSGANVYVVWNDDTPGNGEIYLRKSVDGGAAWQNPKRLTNNAGASANAAIAVSGDAVHVAWSDDTPGDYEIYYRKSVTAGNLWQSAKRLTNTAGNSWNPAIAVESENVCLAWHDEKPGNYEIFLKASADGGTTWGTAVRLTNDAGDSWETALATNASTAYVAWADSKPGNYDIFLRYGSPFSD